MYPSKPLVPVVGYLSMKQEGLDQLLLLDKLLAHKFYHFHCWISHRKYQYVSKFSIISQHWDGTYSINSSSCMTRTSDYSTQSILLVLGDVIVTQGARAMLCPLVTKDMVYSWLWSYRSLPLKLSQVFHNATMHGLYSSVCEEQDRWEAGGCPAAWIREICQLMTSTYFKLHSWK